MSILNKQNTKAYILAAAKDVRPGWDCTRVSASAMLRLELKLQSYIRDALRRHPSKGHTFREFLS